MRTGPALKRSLNVWTTPTVSSLLLAGWAAARRLTMPSSSACACAAVTPYFRRANTVRLRMSRRLDLVRQRDRRHPELGVGRELDAGRHHADDRPRLAVDADGQAEHAAIAAVARLPEGVAEDHDALGARLVVAAPEAAAEEHRLAQQVEAVGGDPDARRVLRRRPRVAHGHRSAQEGGQAFVRGRAGAPVEQVGPRDRLAAAGGRLALDAEDVEPVGLGEGQAADQDGVDQREHRGVDADAQGQGRNRHDAEPSILDEEAQREAQVLQQAHDGCYGRGRRRLTVGRNDTAV